VNILVFGAHPDDPDFKAGGVAYLYGRAGHRVKFVSMTNGDAGHHQIGGVELARRRREETQAVARVLGLAEYQVLDNHDGELEPTLPNRRQIIRIIREFEPDLILAPRPNDYHPDHRYTAQLIQDAAYMILVPNVCAFAERLTENPVIVYVSDTFQKPYPFTPDVAVAIDDVIEQKLAMAHAHASQVYEWLPYVGGYLDQVPAALEQRRAWLRQHMEPRFRRDADRYRDLLIARYGEQAGRAVRYAEAFESCEYGAPLTEQNIGRLFPF